MQFITRMRRDRWRDQILTAGEELRQKQSLRHAINGHVWPEEAQYLDAEIDRLHRRLDRLRDNLKRTA